MAITEVFGDFPHELTARPGIWSNLNLDPYELN